MIKQLDTEGLQTTPVQITNDDIIISSEEQEPTKYNNSRYIKRRQTRRLIITFPVRKTISLFKSSSALLINFHFKFRWIDQMFFYSTGI